MPCIAHGASLVGTSNLDFARMKAGAVRRHTTPEMPSAAREDAREPQRGLSPRKGPSGLRNLRLRTKEYTL